ncbi:uncharacterized protein LOC131890916 [Tigriopus californicus]|uniref:uncharacterized protein LOC131890916 n=1 Tax=Tigriopus californicus TaxID=6832 RepID=UPI0027D9D31E|nr:uncharacterized protein LOC131890916 [Tigriopus californicus]
MLRNATRGPVRWSAAAVRSTPARLATPLRRGLHGPSQPEEFTSEAQYPALPTYKSSDEREFASLKTQFQGLKTVEEKQYFLNKPKFFGWYSYKLIDDNLMYGSQEFAQAMTSTHVLEGLPDVYESTRDLGRELALNLAPKYAQLMSDLKKIESADEVLSERIYGHEPFGTPIPESTHALIKGRETRRVHALNSFWVKHILGQAPHLMSAQMDHSPRLEAFWFRSGMGPDKSMIKRRRGSIKHARTNPLRPVKRSPDDEPTVYEPYDRSFQYKAQPILVHRHPSMIPPFLERNHDLCHQQDEVPEFKLDPRTLGYSARSESGVNLPGFWTGSPKSFASLQILSSFNEIGTRVTNTTLADDQYGYREDLMCTKMILAGFGQLLSQACHLGYEPINNISEPLTTQTIITDGLKWKLGAFQLNRTALIDEEDVRFPNNVCWIQPEEDMMKTNEETGQAEVNIDLMGRIIQFYLAQPSAQPEAVAQSLNNVRNNYNRTTFFKQYRALCAREDRPFHLKKPVTQPFQKLYRIDHPAMLFSDGTREEPWFLMTKMDFLGKKHWHPEFKHLDHFDMPRVPKAIRKRLGIKKWKKVVAPIPDDTK